MGQLTLLVSKVLGFAAVAEASTGLALLVVPSLVGQLLLGQQLAGVAIPVARVTGIALIALGIGCGPATPLVGMFVYSAVVTLYLAYLGFAGEFFRGAAVARGRSSRPPVNPSRAGSISRCGSSPEILSIAFSAIERHPFAFNRQIPRAAQ